MNDFEEPDFFPDGTIKSKRKLIVGAKCTQIETQLVVAAANLVGATKHGWCLEQLKLFHDSHPVYAPARHHAERLVQFQYLLSGLDPVGSETIVVQTKAWGPAQTLTDFANKASKIVGTHITKSLVFRYLLTHGVRLAFTMPPEALWMVSAKLRVSELARNTEELKRVIAEIRHFRRKPKPTDIPRLPSFLKELEEKHDKLVERIGVLRDATRPEVGACARVLGMDTFHWSFDDALPKHQNLKSYFDEGRAKAHEAKQARKNVLLFPEGSTGPDAWESLEQAVKRHLGYGYSLSESTLRAKLESAARLTLIAADATPDEHIQAMYLDQNGEPLSRDEQLERAQLEQEAKALPPPSHQTEQAATTLPAPLPAPAISQPGSFPEVRLDEEEAWSSED